MVYASDSKLILNATSAILYDATYQVVLYEKNAYTRVPNASTTKMLTAIVAYENANVKDVVIISKNAATTGGSVINLRSGDHVTLDGLIKGLLIHSGNDAAVAIAEYVGGDVESFCQMLNDKAIEMGLKDTHFVTPHGLDKENHYSSAYDLAKMAEYLLNTPYLAEIVKQKNVTIEVENQSRILTTTNEMLSLYEGVNGVKTGFTGDAGRCLVTSCEKNGRLLISVILGCGTKAQRTQDSIKILNYGFQEFEVVDICESMQKDFIIEVEKGKNTKYQVHLNAHMPFPIKKDNLDTIKYEYHFASHFVAPINKKEIIGNIIILVGQKRVAILVIKSPQNIERKAIRDYFYDIFSFDLKKYEISL